MAIATEQLTLTGPAEGPVVDLQPAAFEARRILLATAGVCREVRDAETQRAASEALTAIKSLLKQTEDSRTTIKAPLLAATRAIDQTVKNFVADLEAESKRLSLLVGAYAESERRKAEAARLEAEKQERLIREEQERRERERLAQARSGDTAGLNADLDTIAAEADEAALEVRQAAASVAVAAPTGVSVRKNWKFEVVDVKKLFAARPELCVIEPNQAAIRALVKHTQDLPGVRVWCETVAIAGARAETSLPTKVEAYDY